MATSTLIAHGSEAGYRAELQTDSVCARCRKGHQMYDRLSRAARTKGAPRPDRFTTLDNQWTPGKRGRQPATARPTPEFTVAAVRRPITDENDVPLSSAAETSSEPAGPSLGDRLAERIRGMMVNEPESPVYVPEQDTGYVHQIDDLEGPGPEWEPAEDTEYIINAAGLAKIEQNLGTYLSIVGMTAEMIDPVCGPVLAENFDNIVSRWSKVISHYPKAAELFMDGKGGVIFTWIGAIQATWPVLYMMYQHHLAKTITYHNGQVFRKGQMPSMNGQTVDALTPEFQYSAT